MNSKANRASLRHPAIEQKITPTFAPEIPEEIMNDETFESCEMVGTITMSNQPFYVFTEGNEILFADPVNGMVNITHFTEVLKQMMQGRMKPLPEKGSGILSMDGKEFKSTDIKDVTHD